MLNKIITKLGMYSLVFNVLVCLKKGLDQVRDRLRLDTATNIVKENFQVHIPLILDEHVV